MKSGNRNKEDGTEKKCVDSEKEMMRQSCVWLAVVWIECTSHHTVPTYLIPFTVAVDGPTQGLLVPLWVLNLCLLPLAENLKLLLFQPPSRDMRIRFSMEYIVHGSKNKNDSKL